MTDLCRRPGCDVRVFAWFDPFYCSADCRAAWDEPRRPAPEPITTGLLAATEPDLRNAPGFAGATAYVVDTSEIFEHRDGRWAIAADPVFPKHHNEPSAVKPAGEPEDVVLVLEMDTTKWDRAVAKARGWFSRGRP